MLRASRTIGALVPPTTVVVYSPHMAAKNPNEKRKATLDSVLSTVKRGFADLENKMDRGFAAVADDIADIKSKMATKDDIANLGGQLASVERELKSIRGSLGGVGEPTICVATPAVLNASFAATGRRIQSFPLTHHNLRIATTEYEIGSE
jgi:hypothetical protein